MRQALAFLAALALASTAQADERCKAEVYLEPGAFVSAIGSNHAPAAANQSGVVGKPVLRVGAGLAFTRCTGEVSTFRFGASGFVSTLVLPGLGDSHHNASKGIGFESEGSLATVGRAVVGARVGVDWMYLGSYAVSVGARIRFERDVWVGADVMHITRPDGLGPPCSEEVSPSCTSPVDVILVGAGLQGRAGAVAAVATVAIAALVWGMPRTPYYD